MNILNRKNRIIFLLAGFAIALILVGFPTSITAQENQAFVDEYDTRLKNAMESLGCNSVQECDNYCYGNETPVLDCSAYDELITNPPVVVSYMQEAGCAGNIDECTTYCNGAATLKCRGFLGYTKNVNGLNKLYDKLKKEAEVNRYSDHPLAWTNADQAARWTLSIINSIKNNVALPPNCPGHAECMAYCMGFNTTACLDYAEKTGFISSQYADIEREYLDYKTKDGKILAECASGSGWECRLYCLNNQHSYQDGRRQDGCLALAEKGLIMTSREADIYGKFIALIRAGQPTPAECSTVGGCQTICSRSENFTECAEFAKKAGWIEKEIPPEQQVVVAAIEKGNAPGGCTDEVACRAYCEDVDHLGECVDFVEKFNLASGDELKEMRKMADLKKSGVAFPGNCKNKESCLKYCENSAHAVECMEFAQKAGFIPKEDAEAVGKILPYLKSGGKLPGGCTTKESCDAYCDSDANTIECVDFATGAGFMTKEEADIVKKVGGKGPGNCRSREACDNYCKDEKHIDECVDFAVKAGFISEADATDAKKYKITSGPGNCKSKAECEAFCVLPENQETCFNFAKDHGMISEEDLKNIEQYRNQGPPDFSQVNPKWLACMEKEMGSAAFGRFKAGKSDRPDVSAIQAAQKKCQSEMGPDTKECLAKPTCEEFVACLNPSGRQTSQQKGPEQESPPELKKRMDSCQDELKETKKKEVQEKFDACFTLSCSEYEACMKSIAQSGDQQDGQQQAQGTPDPKIKAKAEACQKEKINACLSKSCGEFQSCLNALGGGGGGGGTPDPAVLSKVMSCQPKKGGGGGSQPPSGGSQPPGGYQQPPSGGDQSQIPQGFSSWEAFCRANSGDSRCAAYAPQIPQQYPLLIDHSFLGAMLRYLLK